MKERNVESGNDFFSSSSSLYIVNLCSLHHLVFIVDLCTLINKLGIRQLIIYPIFFYFDLSHIFYV